ncbi:transient receptor potential cation channel protein painless-like [Bradysia coprophila]|uniref:transient receptor potential cation channel protein painless-like n=1 Tax=Bradysia coprophila TaxID=38358 RepID=UPI00187D9077|nr:transient receptor potential cation channel protein painless-like [Bradysia coprophila]
MEKCQDFVLDSFLEELEVFRWRLYIAKDESTEERSSLFEEACSKQISELFIEECLIAGCDTNTLSNEAKMMVKKLLHKGDMLPSIQRDDDKFWDFSRLRMCILYANERFFIKGIRLIGRKNPAKLKEIIENSGELINIAASNHLTLTIETLISLGGKVEYAAFLSACKTGSWQSLETLLPHLDLEENKLPLLRELYISAACADEKQRESFEKCYDLLLNESDFDVSSMDSHGRSAMYYVSNLPKKVDQFLEMGTYIGMQNGSSTPNVSFIAPAALEAHFNNCINFVQSEDNKKVTYIEFDYKNLIAPRNGNDDLTMPNEMTAIEFISQSVDYKHLLVHPLIWSFISLKWRQLALIRNIDCALYVLFALSNLCYVLALYGDAPKDITAIFFILTGNMTFYVAIRRIVHLLFCNNEYRKSLINYFHCYQTFQVIVSVSLVHYLEDINRVIPAMCVLLITCELFVLAGSIFWTFSLYYIMFLSIAWSSMKSLMVYIVLLPSFIISYWLMITNDKPKTQEDTYKHQFFDYLQQALMVPNSEDNIADSQLEHFKINFISLIRNFVGDEDDHEDHDNVPHSIVSLMKAVIGWHRDVDDKIASVEWTFLGLLIVLISLLSIINMNLVNSLAVTGTQAIQSKSELTCLTQRVLLLVQYEEALTNRRHWFWQFFQNTIVMQLFDFLTQFDVLENVREDNHRKIYIGPGNEILYHIQSQSNSAKSGDVGIISKVLFSAKKGEMGPYTDGNDDKSQGCGSKLWKKCAGIFFNKTDRMNPQIVENARNVIDRRKDDQKEKLDIDTCIHRIEKLETAILNLTKHLSGTVKLEN